MPGSEDPLHLAPPSQGVLLVESDDWRIIPWENLVAQTVGALSSCACERSTDGVTCVGSNA